MEVPGRHVELTPPRKEAPKEKAKELTVEVADFKEASQSVRAKNYREKILHEDVERYGETSESDPRNQLLKRIHERLYVALPDLPQGEQYFLASPEINAFAIKGESNVFIHDGLLRQYAIWCEQNKETPSEDAFAFVVAHELGHVRQNTQEIDAEAASEDDGGPKASTEELKHKHQQRLNDEYDADRFGLHAIAGAGYNPREGLKMLRFLQGLNEGSSLPTTHPRSEDRLRELTALVESPDTIIQNTDKAPAVLAEELIKELSQEDPNRPGTALYRGEARERLGDFVLAAETMSDALEVVQVAQMHRWLAEVNRVRQVDAIRTVHAKHIVVDNVRELLGGLERVYNHRRNPSFGLVFGSHNLPTDTTRYVMREYEYTNAAAEPDPRAAAFDAELAAKMTTDLDSSLKLANSRIDQQLKSVTDRLPALLPDSEEFVRVSEYQQKLEYIRDHLAVALEGVAASTLQEIVANTDLSATESWSDKLSTQGWLAATEASELLEWCKRDGSALFSQLVHPPDEKMRRAVGDTATVDSRYQRYLPEDLTAQEDFFTPAGRTAFIEQALFANVQKALERSGGSSERRVFLERSAGDLDQVRLQLGAIFETRYAVFSKSQALGKAMAEALLSLDYDYSAEYRLIQMVRDFSEAEARLWLTKIQPLWVDYRPSANGLFINETGLDSLAVSKGVPNVYDTFFFLEKNCTKALRKLLEEQGDTTTVTKATDDLTKAVALGNERVRHDALNQMAGELRKQTWSTANLKELDRRLSPILQLTQPFERAQILRQVLGAGHENMSNLTAVIEYATEVCGEYAQSLLDKHWEQFITATTEPERFRLLQKVYAHPEGFYQLSSTAYNKDFSNRVAIEYITLSMALKGEGEFVKVLTELASGDFAYGAVGQPLFASQEMQRRVESLSDQDILQVAVACKTADAAGKVRDALHNSFTVYITRRVLEMYGVQGFNPNSMKALTKFDTSRPFAEVFAGIGQHVMPYYSEMMLRDCVWAYQKTPADVVGEGVVQHYKPIPTHALQVGRSLEGLDLDKTRLDQYAKRYDPAATPFHERREYSTSEKRLAIEAHLKNTGLTSDRVKDVFTRLSLVNELVPEKTDYRDEMFGEIEADLLAEYWCETKGHRIVMHEAVADKRVVAEYLYTFYRTALPNMVDQTRMQLWGRRADGLYHEYLAYEDSRLDAELARIQMLFPAASFARDEALLALADTSAVQTPEQARQVQALLSEMQRQTENVDDLSSQSQLERFNMFTAHLGRGEKKDFILWTIGATDTPPKSLRAYGALNAVSVEDVPAFVFAATPQEREQFLLRMFVGSNGLFEPQNPEDQANLDQFIEGAFTQIFPDDPDRGVAGPPRKILRTVFTTVLTEYDPYRRGKIFIGMLEAMQNNRSGGRGEKIVSLMAELGPVFIKVGQVLSETETAPGQPLLPDDVREPMKKLKQSAKRFHRLAAVLSLEASGEFKADNPNRIVAVEDTLAAASIKQVNAVVRADGKAAVEKVLRPSIEKHLEEDVRVLGLIIERLRKFTTVPHGIEDVGATYVREESDFAREVANTKKMSRSLNSYRSSAVVRKMRVRTTRVYGYSKTHIQEERVRGLSLEELTRVGLEPEAMTGLAEKHNLSEVEQRDYLALAAQVEDVRLQAFDALAFQYFQADAFHADPHAGNIFITPNQELVMIDNGSIGETKQADRNKLKQFFLGFASKKPTELRMALRGLAKGLAKMHMDAIVSISEGAMGDADKMNQILMIVTENATELDPAFNKFLKSFATGAYLMSGLKPDDVRTVLGAYTQGDSGSLRAYAATSIARAMRDKPDSLVASAGRKLFEA